MEKYSLQRSSLALTFAQTKAIHTSMTFEWLQVPVDCSTIMNAIHLPLLRFRLNEEGRGGSWRRLNYAEVWQAGRLNLPAGRMQEEIGAQNRARNYTQELQGTRVLAASRA